MQAITTKFIAPTNTRVTRIRVKAAAGSILVSWDNSLDTDENHTAAAKVFAEKYKWSGTWVGGGLPSGEGNVYVNVKRMFGCGFTIRKVK